MSLLYCTNETKTDVITAFQLVTGRRWKGCAFGGVKGRTQLPGLVDDYLQGRLKVDEFITHRQPLKEINQAFADMHAGDCIRCVVSMNEAAIKEEGAPKS